MLFVRNCLLLLKIIQNVISFHMWQILFACSLIYSNLYLRNLEDALQSIDQNLINQQLSMVDKKTLPAMKENVLFVITTTLNMFHFVLKCPLNISFRLRNIKNYYFKKPSVFKINISFRLRYIKNYYFKKTICVQNCPVIQYKQYQSAV